MDEWKLFIGVYGVLNIPMVAQKGKLCIGILRPAEDCDKLMDRREMLLKVISEKAI